MEAVLVDLEAQAFDPAQAAASLERLALTMRVIASGEVPDRQSLLVEIASLVSQTSALYESRDFKPRLEVDVP